MDIQRSHANWQFLLSVCFSDFQQELLPSSATTSTTSKLFRSDRWLQQNQPRNVRRCASGTSQNTYSSWWNLSWQGNRKRVKRWRAARRWSQRCVGYCSGLRPRLRRGLDHASKWKIKWKNIEQHENHTFLQFWYVKKGNRNFKQILENWAPMQVKLLFLRCPPTTKKPRNTKKLLENELPCR